MISEVVGSPRLTAKGIIIAMIDIGPRPGNIPINVPIRQPTTTMAMALNDSAAARPVNKPSSMI